MSDDTGPELDEPVRLAWLVSASHATLARWTVELARLGVRHIRRHSNIIDALEPLVREFRSPRLIMIESDPLDPADRLHVFLTSPIRSRSDRIVIVGPPNASSALSSLNNGATGYLITATGPAPSHSPQPPTWQEATSESDVVYTVARLPELDVDVLRKLADGHSNREIGRRVGLSESGVKICLESLTEHFAARDRAHLVLLALQAGVIT